MSMDINTAVAAGLSKFRSIFTGGSIRAFTDGSGLPTKSYSQTTRGKLAYKDSINLIDFSQGYYFQFNPQTVNDAKVTNYEERTYTGLDYNDYIWAGGGARTFTFQLFLDNTPQSHNSTFIPRGGSITLANEVVVEGSSAGSNIVNEVSGFVGAQRYTGNKPFGKVNFIGSAFSNTRVDERGILPELDFIRSFLYSEIESNENLPLFSQGGIINSLQFKAPPVAILSMGPLLFEGIIKSAPITYTLYDTDLTPLRATVDIEFAAYEFTEVKKATL